MIITGRYDIELLKKRINRFSYASKYSSIQQLIDRGGQFPDYPTPINFSKWHILVIHSEKALSSATIDCIANIFSAVTKLSFNGLDIDSCKYMIALLQHPLWANQLTNLTVSGYKVSAEQVHSFFNAINGLTSLHHLAIELFDDVDSFDLPILSRLKMISVHFYIITSVETSYENIIRCFLRSFDKYATENADLQVHLSTQCLKYFFKHAGENFKRHCVGLSHLYREINTYNDDVSRICFQFSFITSLDIGVISYENIRHFFNSFSLLKQLVHLKFTFLTSYYKNTFKYHPRPVSQLTSVLALDLHLTIPTHEVVEWLNLQWTLPNLQTIHLIEYRCRNCDIHIGQGLHLFTGVDKSLSETEKIECLKCLGETLPKLHSSVYHMKKITVDLTQANVSILNKRREAMLAGDV